MVRVSGGGLSSDPTSSDLYVLVGNNLKKWKVNPSPDAYDVLVAECDLERILSNAYDDHFTVRENLTLTVE
jgi:hypothetical protein